MGLNAKYAHLALQRALSHAGLSPESIGGDPRVALVVGQGYPSVPSLLSASSSSRVSPYAAFQSTCSSVSASLATSFGILGPSHSLASACSTGSHCIAAGADLLHLGRCDIALVGAGEEAGTLVAQMFDAAGALAKTRNETPERASRPFDEGRDGFVIAEGAGIIVLEGKGGETGERGSL